MTVNHVCHRCGADFPVQWGDTDAFCDECATIEDGRCPKCYGEIDRESVDIGVGVINGPYGCACGWSEWPEYDSSEGPCQAELENPGYSVDSRGGMRKND